MTSENDKDYISYLNSVNLELQYIFLYTVPWFGLVCSTFSTIALAKRRRRGREKNLLIYIFQWRYAISIIYWLNMVFIDDQYSTLLFNYNLRYSVPDPICKLRFMFLRFIYCASPWIQVV
jgi:hypothetical protein